MKTDHIKMLYDIGELNKLFTESISIESFLQKIVEMVSKHMNAEVCSIYLYDETIKELVLKATVGLAAESINNVRLKLGEGLVGLSLQNMEPICEKCGTDNPNFKYYPGIDEELYESFLAAPILRGNIRIGVLVVQRAEGKIFGDQDIMALSATASQLASMIENIKYIIAPNQSIVEPESPVDLGKLKFVKGRSASNGFAYKETVIVNRESFLEIARYLNTGKNYSINDFDNAIQATGMQLEQLQKKVEEKLADAASLIFSAHLLMLKDISFTGAMRTLIEEGVNPTEAVIKKYLEYRDVFLNSPSPLIREKVQDIEDLAKRILDNLAGKGINITRYNGRIAILRDILPSDLLAMSAEDVAGIILVSGGVTSHVSILARSLHIPVVIADVPELLKLPADAKALIDAELGNIYINPSEDIINSYTLKNRVRSSIYKSGLLKKPSYLTDGARINLKVNINLLSDLKNIEGIYTDGVGLYRTEFPFIIRNDFPSEEEQVFIYKKLVSGMQNKPVTFRTLDIGGDKVLSYYQISREENPFLGMRSIRFSLRHREIFKQQIRAILRAGYNSEIKIMFPMISSLDEYITSRDIVFECIHELEQEGIEHKSDPEIGIMVEIPSIVNIIEDMAKNVDFLSIGTNDLIQYTLAVDRTNEKVADLYVAHHPAILRSLKKISDAGKFNNIDVSICGDMAGDERYIPFLIGIGIHTLSVDSIYLPKVKKLISMISFKDAERIADEMLLKDRITDIDNIINSQNIDIFNDNRKSVQ